MHDTARQEDLRPLFGVGRRQIVGRNGTQHLALDKKHSWWQAVATISNGDQRGDAVGARKGKGRCREDHLAKVGAIGHKACNGMHYGEKWGRTISGYCCRCTLRPRGPVSRHRSGSCRWNGNRVEIGYLDGQYARVEQDIVSLCT